MRSSNVEKQEREFEDYIANLDDSRYRKVEQILKGHSGSVFEIGCCGGEFLSMLKAKGWDVVGYEVSKKNARMGVKRNIPVILGDANEGLPLAQGTFDVVIAGEVIEHMFDDLTFLKECERLLREDGMLIVTTPNLISFKNRILMLFGKNPRFAVADYHYHVYTKKLLSQLILKAGLRLESLIGNYVIYSKCRERVTGAIFERLGDFSPSMSEHFIAVLRPQRGKAAKIRLPAD